MQKQWASASAPRSGPAGGATPVAWVDLCAIARVLLLGLTACSADSAPDPRLLAIEPASVSAAVDTRVELLGADLYDDVRISLGSTREPRVRDTWQVRLGDHAMESVERRDPQTLRFVVPAGLPAADYRVVVTTPVGRELTLSKTLSVTEADDADLVLHVEDAAKGGGSDVVDRTLRPGDTLDLFAIFRSDGGRFVRTADVAWSASDLPSALTETSGASTSFAATETGEAVVRAEHASGASAETGTLRVTLDDESDAGAGSLRVSIEDAPGGTGMLVSDRALTTDDSLDMYAVARTEDGGFVQDLVADWSLTDRLAASAEADVVMYTLAPARPGSGRVRASHALGETESGVIRVEAGRAATLSVLPAAATLTVGDEPLQFELEGRDAKGNLTTQVGELAWLIASGPIGDISDSGLFTPRSIGAGRVQAVSTLSVMAESAFVTVLPGVATTLHFVSVPATPLVAGDPAFQLAVRGTDAAGNDTAELGTLHYSVLSGGISELDATSGLLTPLRAGTSVIRVQNSTGAYVDSPSITVAAAAFATLSISPTSAVLSADAAPLAFSAVAVDAYGNLTSDRGTLTWSVETGPITTLAANSGVLDPIAAGSGTLRVTSSYGPTAVSGTVTITPGHAFQLTVTPPTLTSMRGDPSTRFRATGLDADGNPTSDLGTLSFAVNTGTIGQLDATTGVFTPTIAGSGTIRATSSYGPSALSGTVTVQPYVSPVTVSALRAASLWQGTQKARFEVDVQNPDPREAWVTGLWLSWLRSSTDVGDQFTTWGDYRNPSEVAAGATATFVFYVDVSSSAGLGSVQVTANVETFHPTLGGPAQATRAQATTVSLATLLPSISFTAPVVPANRICSGGGVSFDATVSSILPTRIWRFQAGTPSTSGLAEPNVTWMELGNHPYSLTIIGTTSTQSSALGSAPIFVGAVAAQARDTYPTGSLVFASPQANEDIDMADLPDDGAIAMPGTSNLQLLQCNGSPVSALGYKYVTLFVDRGRLPAGIDADATLPGIQVDLDTGNGSFAPVGLENDSVGIDGPGMVYGEFYHPTLAQVTAAGVVNVNLTGDETRPSVLTSIPPADCGNSCLYGRGQPWVFQFSEPVDVDSLSNITVQRLSGTCAVQGTATSISASGSYDPGSRTLTLTPPTTGNQSVRIILGTTVTDTADTPNTLVSYTRCASLTTLATAAAPTAPLSSAPTPASFSPDGDGTADSTRWNVTVDSSVRRFRLQVVRGGSSLWGAVVSPVGAGAYSVTWDGRDSSGRVVPNGYYRYDLTSYNADGVASATRSGALKVASAVHFVGVLRRF